MEVSVEKDFLWSTSFPRPPLYPVSKGSGAATDFWHHLMFSDLQMHLSYFSILSISGPSSSNASPASSLYNELT